MQNEFENQFKHIARHMNQERKAAQVFVALGMIGIAGAVIGLALSLSAAEANKPKEVSARSGYLACVTPGYARQALIADDAQIFVKEGFCIPTADFGQLPVIHTGNDHDIANVVLDLDDATYNLWLPVEALK